MWHIWSAGHKFDIAGVIASNADVLYCSFREQSTSFKIPLDSQTSYCPGGVGNYDLFMTCRLPIPRIPEAAWELKSTGHKRTIVAYIWVQDIGTGKLAKHLGTLEICSWDLYCSLLLTGESSCSCYFITFSMLYDLGFLIYCFLLRTNCGTRDRKAACRFKYEWINFKFCNLGNLL